MSTSNRERAIQRLRAARNKMRFAAVALVGLGEERAAMHGRDLLAEADRVGFWIGELMALRAAERRRDGAMLAAALGGGRQPRMRGSRG